MKRTHGAWRGGLVGALLLVAASPRSGADDAAPLSSRVRLASPRATAVVQSSLRRASERLRRPECQRVFSDFTDASGVSLQARLDQLGRSGDGYLGLVLFRDGSEAAGCDRGGILAFTSPGNRVVRVCGDAFVRRAEADPLLGEAVLIHEVLHSLGLGENPPSPEEITLDVLRRCG